MTDSPAFRYTAPARSIRAMGVLGGLWAVLAYGWLRMEAETWIVAGLALFSLPALWEIVTGRVASVTLAEAELRWQSGQRSETVPLAQIDHVRLDRRFDGAMRVTLVLRDQRRLRLPPDCVPPARAFEAALHRAGLRTERHPFSLF